MVPEKQKRIKDQVSTYITKLLNRLNSRDKILAAVKKNQPPQQILPGLETLGKKGAGDVAQFTTVFTNIGGKIYEVDSYETVIKTVQEQFPTAWKVATPIEELDEIANVDLNGFNDPHALQTVDLAILQPQFGVAENGAVWLSETDMKVRVLPFICQHLAVVLQAKQLVPTMHEAYTRIGDKQYGFGAFIAGPSKTADIEQSLVLGAHGPKSMTLFLFP